MTKFAPTLARVSRALLFAALISVTQNHCSGGKPLPANSEQDPKTVLVSSAENRLMAHIRRLSSDEFEGRAPGTPGEKHTVSYLTEEFTKMGLAPGNPDGTYIQNVPLAAIRGRPSASFAAGPRRMQLRYPQDYLAVSSTGRPVVTVDKSEMVFVGYGVVAPEYQWNDFKDMDVRGKTLVILVNDPPVPDSADPSKLDEKAFEGKRMTYYGRYTYKYEMAARKGAAAALIVHETAAAGYGYSVLIRSSAGENYTVENGESRDNRLSVQGWITTRTAVDLFSMAGMNFSRLKAAARSRSFRPVSMGATASFNIRNKVRKIASRNVVARLDGADPALRTEYVIYSAHWDHLGKDSTLKGDQIYNGALDNASGVGGLLEIAQAYARMKVRPRRSILFLAFTGEEMGLLGASYYARNPLYPLLRTTANINLDCLYPWGRTRDLIVIGLNDSPLHRIAQEIAESEGRRLVPDPEPEKGFIYRSDQFEFIKRGVAALYTDGGTDMIGKPVEYGLRKRSEYNRRHYHKVSDEIKRDWDLSGAVDDLRILYLVGCRVASCS